MSRKIGGFSQITEAAKVTLDYTFVEQSDNWARFYLEGFYLVYAVDVVYLVDTLIKLGLKI